MKRTMLLLVFIAFQLFCWSQNIPQLQKLKDYAQKKPLPVLDTSANSLVLSPNGRINYLYPLYQLFGEETKFRSLYKSDYYDELSECISFTEDYQSSLQYAARGYDTLSITTQKQVYKAIDGLRNITHVDARRYISFLAKTHRVIMINEAHNKPLHRAFVMSLLPELYKKGFRYLAMEMLNNFSGHSLNTLTAFTGYYSSEPVAGELIRKALETGFTLVSYEDTLSPDHSPTIRDSIQAAHIYDVIKNNDSAKILVLAGYGHISEHRSTDGFIPMALAFKNMSGIDPLTIDQTEMTEGSNMEYGRVLYRDYTQKFSLQAASVAFLNNEPINISNNPDYDLSVIHPPTSYRDGRPTWLALDGLRKPLYIKPVSKGSFLAQAYYQTEWTENGPDGCVPADQTYIPTNNENYLLYLRKGKYTVAFRDMEYKIIGRLNIEVN